MTGPREIQERDYNSEVTEMEGEYAVGWGTLALLNAGLAQCKNRGGGVWFVISLILGPLATLLLVIRPPGAPGHTGV